MEVKNQRFNLRLTEQELAALRKLSEYQRVSMSEVLAKMICRKAKREKIWAD